MTLPNKCPSRGQRIRFSCQLQLSSSRESSELVPFPYSSTQRGESLFPSPRIRLCNARTPSRQWLCRSFFVSSRGKKIPFCVRKFFATLRFSLPLPSCEKQASTVARSGKDPFAASQGTVIGSFVALDSTV